jgi:hypothetical protein
MKNWRKDSEEGGRQKCCMMGSKYTMAAGRNGEKAITMAARITVLHTVRMTVHCNPSPFDKQFCMANTAVFIS